MTTVRRPDSSKKGSAEQACRQGLRPETTKNTKRKIPSTKGIFSFHQVYHHQPPTTWHYNNFTHSTKGIFTFHQVYHTNHQQFGTVTMAYKNASAAAAAKFVTEESFTICDKDGCKKTKAVSCCSNCLTGRLPYSTMFYALYAPSTLSTSSHFLLE